MCKIRIFGNPFVRLAVKAIIISAIAKPKKQKKTKKQK